MVRLLHVSDTHLGYRQYHSDQRREDFMDAWRQCVDIANREGVDALVHTGDLYHSKNPDLETQIDVAEQIRRLECPFLPIVGNHERKRDRQFVDHLEMGFDNVTPIAQNAPIEIGDVSIHGWDAISSTEWDTTDLTIPETQTEYDIVCLHHLVSPIVPDRYDPYRATEILNRFERDVDAVLLGDYHATVFEEMHETVLSYPGSTERTSAEEPGDKSVTLWETGDELTHETVPLETRPFHRVRVEIRDSPLDEIRSRLNDEDLDGSVTEVILTGERVEVNKSQIHRLVEASGAEISRVTDNRETDTEEITAVDWDASDIESTLDDQLGELELSETTQQIEDIVRDPDVKKTHVRDEASDLI